MMNMMYGLTGWWLIGMGMMVFFWVAIILLVIWVVRSLFPREMRSGHDQALETLRSRSVMLAAGSSAGMCTV